MDRDELLKIRSKGHVAFLGDYEYYIADSGALYRAPLSAVLDIYTGNRIGRWEAPAHMAKRAMKYAREAFAS